MSSIGSAHLVLFFTYGMSLTAWDRIGIFEREVVLYRALRPHLKGISFVTYGDREDLRYAGKLQGIDILCNHWKLPLNFYAKLIPFLHSKMLRRADIFKSNQTNGAQAAMAAARLHRKRFIARCGYMWSDFVAKGAEISHSPESARRIERKVFSASDKVIVTTEAMKEVVIGSYRLRTDKVRVIPNYVDTGLFTPKPELRRERKVCFVGRLDAQKNPLGLIEALAGIDVRTTMIGTGPMKGEAEALARKLALDIDFIERMSHNELPGILNKASLFVLPSFYEGHPKTLIEAMSCGLPVIGADSPGIRELIKHGETGYLCGTDPYSIRSAIQVLLSDEVLCEHIGKNARQFVKENFALDRVVHMEMDLLSKVAGEKQ